MNTSHIEAALTERCGLLRRQARAALPQHLATRTAVARPNRALEPHHQHHNERHTMTTTEPDDLSLIEAATLSAKDILRRRIDDMERSQEEQPARLAKARSDAEEARGWALIEEPFSDQVTSIQSVDGTTALTLPNITAKELWGARLCFDLLDCGDDYDQIDAVMTRLFSTVNGDTGTAFLIASAALSTIAALIVPQLLEEIEHGGSNYEERVKLAEARAKAWHARVSELRGAHDDAAAAGVKPVDGYDIGATALDPDAFDPEVDPW
jgi:hypothetical protein